MAAAIEESWLAGHWDDHPGYGFIDHALRQRINSYDEWPAVSDYAALFPQAPLTFVAQDSNAVKDCGGYEHFIAAHQAIPTRAENLHDFMNALAWQYFPHSKLCLHQIQNASEQNMASSNKRSVQQNACTLFDECGLILVSENHAVVDSLRQHHWSDLFLTQRPALIAETRLLTLGHALLEKYQAPYIGICGKLIHLDLDPRSSLAEIDQQLALRLSAQLTDTKQLAAFPLLGYPGWHPDNEQAKFYNNTDYFRPR